MTKYEKFQNPMKELPDAILTAIMKFEDENPSVKVTQIELKREKPLALIASDRARERRGCRLVFARAFAITRFELIPMGLAGGLLYGD